MPVMPVKADGAYVDAECAPDETTHFNTPKVAKQHSK
jgi:hypothetical protein